MRPGLRRLSSSALGGQFLRFAAVGAVGFCVDAGVLTALLEAGWADPLGGRLASFGCAVLATFELNRRWSFEGALPLAYPVLLARYVAAQGLGFLCNFGVYAVSLVILPPPLNDPRFCLAVASGAALVINFVGARLVVFRRTAP